MTLAEFATIFALLAVQLRCTDADETVIRAYYDGLEDLEPELLKAAAERLARQSAWFPKTSDWRESAEGIRRERVDAQRAHLRHMPRPACGVCEDTGWEPIDVVEDGQSVRRVRPCACRAARRREILRQGPSSALLPDKEPSDRDGRVPSHGSSEPAPYERRAK